MKDIAQTLAAIDATVEQRCACGCGTQLDPAGESMWFAGPDCQIRFHERNTTNPHEVQNRVDAAEAYDGGDHLRVPLNEPGVEPRSRRAARTHWLTERLRQPNGTLRRLSAGPLRSPLSERLRPEDYWTFEPTVVPRVEGDSGHVATWDETHEWVGEQAHARIQRLIEPELNRGSRPRGIISAVPPPVTTDVPNPVEAIRGLYEQLEAEYRLTPWQEELLRRTYIGPISMDFTPEPMRFDEDVMRFRVSMRVMANQFHEGMRGIGRAVRPFLDGLGASHCHIVFDEVSRKPWKRAAGWHPPRNNPRVRKLHTDYSRRRKRNR